jgi:acyl phosphate:glycerol-3-phosphate acyltransferase
MLILFVLLVSYVIGTIPTARIVSRLVKRIDITRVGDFNPGAANVYRHVSHLAGYAVGLIDLAKGALAMLVAQLFVSEPILLLCGVAVVAGHNWPVFYRFKGGIGVATTLGVLLVLLPIPMGITMLVASVPYFMTRNMTLTSVFWFAPLPLLAWWTGASLMLIIYTWALPFCAMGLANLLRNKNLSEAQKIETKFMRDTT